MKYQDVINQETMMCLKELDVMPFKVKEAKQIKGLIEYIQTVVKEIDEVKVKLAEKYGAKEDKGKYVFENHSKEVAFLADLQKENDKEFNYPKLVLEVEKINSMMLRALDGLVDFV